MITAHIPANLLAVLASLVAAMIVGSGIRLLATRQSDAETRQKRLASLKTWWLLVLMLGAAVLLGRPGVCVMFGVASALAVREFSALVAPRDVDRRAVFLLLTAVPVQFALIFADWTFAYSAVMPIAVALTVAVSQVSTGETDGYIRSTAGLAWGAMVLIFGLSHSAMLTTIPANVNPAAGPIGWLVYLVILTETNDISQALVGRRFGNKKRHRITPNVSPNKTWEGFCGGMCVTILLAIALSPVLTPLSDVPFRLGGAEWKIPYLWSAIAGVLIAVSGFFGDINMSAVKRDAGVKDSSTLLPGMGGMIDRIDSLTFAAPVFYYFVQGLI